MSFTERSENENFHSLVKLSYMTNYKITFILTLCVNLTSNDWNNTRILYRDLKTIKECGIIYDSIRLISQMNDLIYNMVKLFDDTTTCGNKI